MKITTLTSDISLKRQLESGNEEQLKTVREVIADVRKRGDAAIRMYSEKWDGFAPENLRVTTEEIEEAVKGFDAAIDTRIFLKQRRISDYIIALKNAMVTSYR